MVNFVTLLVVFVELTGIWHCALRATDFVAFNDLHTRVVDINEAHFALPLPSGPKYFSIAYFTTRKNMLLTRDEIFIVPNTNQPQEILLFTEKELLFYDLKSKVLNASPLEESQFKVVPHFNRSTQAVDLQLGGVLHGLIKAEKLRLEQRLCASGRIESSSLRF